MFRIVRTTVTLLGAVALLGVAPIASADPGRPSGDREPPPQQPVPEPPKQEIPCDCEGTSVFATWINVGGRFNDNRIDIRYVKLHFIVDCEAGDDADCSGWAKATVSGAASVPAQIGLSCAASDKCPDWMKATKDVKLRLTLSTVGKNGKQVKITVKHACTDGAPKTTTLTIQYNRRGWPERGASDLNGDGKPDRIS